MEWSRQVLKISFIFENLFLLFVVELSSWSHILNFGFANILAEERQKEMCVSVL